MSILLLLAFLFSLSSAYAEYKGDTRIPDYGSSAHEQRHEAGKHYPGDQYGTPYVEPKSNVQRWNEEQTRRDIADRQHRETQRDNYQDNCGGQHGGDRCRGLYGC